MADEEEADEEDRAAPGDSANPGRAGPAAGRRGCDEPADRLRILSAFGLPPDALRLLSPPIPDGRRSRPSMSPLRDLDPHRLHARLDADLDDPGLALLLDHADLAVALEAGLLDLVGVVDPAVQAQAFFQIRHRELPPPHLLWDDLTVADQHPRMSREDPAQSPGFEGGPGQQAVERHQECRGYQRQEDGARAVDGAAEHRPQDKAEDHVERGLLAEEAFAADPQDGPAEEIDENGADADLKRSDVLGLLPGTGEPLQSMPELVHREPPFRCRQACACNP